MESIRVTVIPANGPVGLVPICRNASKFRHSVIPAKAGIQERGDVNLVRALDPRIRGENSVAVTFNFYSERCRLGIKPTGRFCGNDRAPEFHFT